MGIFGEGVCHVCGELGYHDECDIRELEIESKIRYIDKLYVGKYAVNRQYGILDNNTDAYTKALKSLDSFLNQDPDFDESRVIEGDSWWFFPNSWIGIIGFIIEKETGSIFPLGSGLAGYSGQYKYVPAHWVAIEKYLNGEVEQVKKKTNKDKSRG